LLREVRWHGRGGQGVVTVSRLLAYAALLEGKHVQAFPEFGPERTGAPILGFTRISDEPIEIHSQVYAPDSVVVLDPTLLTSIDVTEGLVRDGHLIVNTERKAAELRGNFKRTDISCHTVDGTRIALDVLGRPIFNTAMLGALIRVDPLAKLDSVLKALEERFPGPLAEKNAEAIRRAYEKVTTNE
jgi:2-oxoacid:acceptor oxidoreductase gamma subunit (pyruvate/2-ketoisovalerate family)